MIKKDWKFYTGIVFLILTIIVDVSFLIVPFLGLSGSITVLFLTIFAAAGECFFLISILFLGKTIVQKVKEKLAIWFKKLSPVPAIHISRGRHITGVWLFLISFIPYPAIELSLLLGYPAQGEHYAYLLMLVVGDILFTISLFLLGEPFWGKLKQLFRWIP
jgi:hypothetical protein